MRGNMQKGSRSVMRSVKQSVMRSVKQSVMRSVKQSVMHGVMHSVMPVSYTHLDVYKRQTEPTTIEDFPIRNRKVVLHVRRRRWLDKEGHNVIINPYPCLLYTSRCV